MSKITDKDALNFHSKVNLGNEINTKPLATQRDLSLHSPGVAHLV